MGQLVAGIAAITSALAGVGGVAQSAAASADAKKRAKKQEELARAQQELALKKEAEAPTADVLIGTDQSVKKKKKSSQSTLAGGLSVDTATIGGL